MSDFALALRSFLYHRRVNLAVALGVAAATAVLTGALIVGSSMRGSLRAITLDRLGKVDLLISSDGFFRESLADETQRTVGFADRFTRAVPAIFFVNGTAEHRNQLSVSRAAEVNVLGIVDDFWECGDEAIRPRVPLGDDQIVINQTLADDLGISLPEVLSGDVRLTVGVPKQKLLPSDSALGDKDDLVERLVDLKIVDVIPARSLGRFGIHPTQIPPRNAFVSIGTLQNALTEGVLKYKPSTEQCNLILVSDQSPRVPPPRDAVDWLWQSLRPDASDLGLRIQRVTQDYAGQTIFDYFSLSSDRLVIPPSGVESLQAAFPSAVPLFTYLANDISKIDNQTGEPIPDGIPFSMVTAVDVASTFQLPSADGGTMPALNDNEIAVNSWAADDLNLKIGDRVRLTYFQPETTHGDETESTVDLTVVHIVPVTRPVEPFSVGRRGAVSDAVYDQPPTTANDPHLTPQVPGLTDAESIERWDLPFETADALRPQDDDYWEYFRTTPKAFVSLATGQRLWSSRFGQVTSFRISADDIDEALIEQQLLQQLRSDGHLLGMQVVPIKQNGLDASSGSTPFDALFLGLSMFVIGAALILVSLLFRLGLQQRSGELGTLLSSGFRQKRVGKIWLLEMVTVCLVGAAMGVLIGIGYAALMLLGLSTWWVGAITTPFLQMHIDWWTLPVGLICGVVICSLTIFWSIRRARAHSVRELLAGEVDTGLSAAKSRFQSVARWILVVCLAAAMGLTLLAAFSLGGESQAGAFMGGGFLVLTAALLWIWLQLQRRGRATIGTSLNLSRLALTNAGRNPLRSTLTIGLVAVASFLILAISAFRLSPTREGTAGFQWVAKTSQPVFANLDTPEGQRSVLRGETKELDPTSKVLSFRYKSGEDASCNNPYQSSQPQVLGVTRDTVEYFGRDDVDRFAFSMTPGDNPWRQLHEPRDDGVIPVIIDKNTAWYSLKIYVPGTRFTVDYDSGQSLTFELVGLLSNSILQGSLLISEENFTRSFPDLSGYRFFLLKTQPTEIDKLQTALADQGFDARGAEALLAGFLAVQNTYLSTFQSLGALGLLLGTFGLAAVQLRSIVERRKELGLMRAVGFSRSRLARMVLLENAWLLALGLAIGIGAALFTTLPHYFFGAASVPWQETLIMFGAIALVGLGTSWLASKAVFKAPLVQSLRATG